MRSMQTVYLKCIKKKKPLCIPCIWFGLLTRGSSACERRTAWRPTCCTFSFNRCRLRARGQAALQHVCGSSLLRQTTPAVWLAGRRGRCDRPSLPTTPHPPPPSLPSRPAAVCRLAAVAGFLDRRPATVKWTVGCASTVNYKGEGQRLLDVVVDLRLDLLRVHLGHGI